MQTKLILFIVLIISLISCKETSQEENVSLKDNPKENTDSLATPNAVDSIQILFNKKEFASEKKARLLEEINICSNLKLDSAGIELPDCSPEFFEVFPLRSDKDIEDGFIVLTKANTGGVALRRILIFERENGELIKVNGFVANLTGRKASPTLYDDLLVRFKDNIEGSDVYYNCILKWQENKYQFSTVESIEEPVVGWKGNVMESVKDSVSQEIYAIIEENGMVF